MYAILNQLKSDGISSIYFRKPKYKPFTGLVASCGNKRFIFRGSSNGVWDVQMPLSIKNVTIAHKKNFYKSVMCYFFGNDVEIDYEEIDKNVPFKSITYPSAT